MVHYSNKHFADGIAVKEVEKLSKEEKFERKLQHFISRQYQGSIFEVTEEGQVRQGCPPQISIFFKKKNFTIKKREIVKESLSWKKRRATWEWIK